MFTNVTRIRALDRIRDETIGVAPVEIEDKTLIAARDLPGAGDPPTKSARRVHYVSRVPAALREGMLEVFEVLLGHGEKVNAPTRSARDAMRD